MMTIASKKFQQHLYNLFSMSLQFFIYRCKWFKETKSVTMNIFRNFEFSFLFKSFVKIELSYVFTINMFSTAENCMEK